MTDQATERASYERFATEFLFVKTWADGDKRTVMITRRSNHGNFIEGDKWMVCIWLGSMNPWYLGEGGLWRYKYGTGFDSHEQAYQYLRRSRSMLASRQADEEEL